MSNISMGSNSGGRSSRNTSRFRGLEEVDEEDESGFIDGNMELEQPV
jgi:hypothetical protein